MQTYRKQNRLKWEQLPNLRDSVMMCDFFELAETAARVRYDEFDPNFEGVCRDYFNLILQIVKTSDVPGGADGVLIPDFTLKTGDAPSSFRYYFGLGLFMRADLPLATYELGCQRTIERAIASSPGCSIVADESVDRLTNYSYEYAYWKEVLSYKVWMGGGWQESERYQMLACALEKLAFFGLCEKKHDEAFERESEKIRASMRSLDECVPFDQGLSYVDDAKGDGYSGRDFSQSKAESPFLMGLIRSANRKARIRTLEIIVDLQRRLSCAA